MSKIIKIFPSPIYSDNSYSLNEKELEIINHVGNHAESNVGNVTSKDKYFLNEYKELTKFKDYCQNQINKFIYKILHINKQTQFYITQSWVNVNMQNDYHHKHKHLNSLISAVYFVSGDTSPIVFTRTMSNRLFPSYEFLINKFIDINNDTWELNNTNGTLLLFPSDIEHYVKTNNSNVRRVSISFNTFVKGIIGMEDRNTEVKL